MGESLTGILSGQNSDQTRMTGDSSAINGGAFSPSSGHSAIGDLFSSSNDYNHNEAYYAWQREEQSAQNNRDWQTQMSNTAMQRSVADYEKAGFSSLAALQGGGASTPSGSSASSSPARAGEKTGASGMLGIINSVANAIGLGLNTAVGMKNASALAKSADAKLITAGAMDRRTLAYEKYFNSKISSNLSPTSSGDSSSIIKGLSKKETDLYLGLMFSDDQLSKDQKELLEKLEAKIV